MSLLLLFILYIIYISQACYFNNNVIIRYNFFFFLFLLDLLFMFWTPITLARFLQNHNANTILLTPMQFSMTYDFFDTFLPNNEIVSSNPLGCVCKILINKI